MISYSATTSGFTTYPCTITGFSVNPTGETSKYSIDGNKCTVIQQFTINGTSNATTKTITLPFNAATADSYPIIIQDNTGRATGMIILRAGFNIADVYRDVIATSWATSGNCKWSIHITYEVAS
jgi:hypothetical protein